MDNIADMTVAESRLDDIGVTAIEQMQTTYEREESSIRKAMYGDGTTKPASHTVTRDMIDSELIAHPLAALYLKADEAALSRNYQIAAIGEDVKEQIINGADYDTAESSYDSQMATFRADHRWD